ncbi:response regulator [Dankookia rubra]|uniref:Response regulator n=1 Tax=Dankookia rubra TaxID=1442381 RepID=A0A4R5QN57_9PROT|nr:response regulator [Dankookia rubra]TDH64676.1 response regulator [Dankookia rubra]
MAQLGKGLRVLLAEDETLAALVISDALADMGHSVMHAADGETALGLAAALPFDVLVTDLAMPRLSGLQLIPLLRAERPDLPVVMMTGWLPPDGACMLAACGMGRTTLLLKPFAMSQLAESLARVVPAAVPGQPCLGGVPPVEAAPAA